MKDSKHSLDLPDKLDVIEQIVSQPTAPFHEYHVKAEIEKCLRDCPGVTLQSDQFHNLLVTYQNGESHPSWVFGAHMDHPGWVRVPEDAPPLAPFESFRQRGPYRFLGGVPQAYFAEEFPIVEFGDFAMWDLPAFHLNSAQRIQSRACDDLIGCAAIVSTFRYLCDNQVPGTCYAAFTRAEEVGFVGACRLAQNWPFPKDSVFLSVETSVAPSRSSMGQGPICRVGDRLSIFDSSATATMLRVSRQNNLQVQRQLLDKGSCEATAMQAFGHRTAGVSVPLGNYHNCGIDNKIRPEYVSLDDLTTLIDLLIGLASHPPSASTAQRDMQAEFDRRIQAHSTFQKASDSYFH